MEQVSKIRGVFSKASDNKISQMIDEWKEWRRTGILKDGLLRDVANMDKSVYGTINAEKMLLDEASERFSKILLLRDTLEQVREKVEATKWLTYNSGEAVYNALTELTDIINKALEG